MPEKVTVDESQWPLLIVTQQVEQLSDAERLGSLELCDRVLHSRGQERYAMVLDNRLAGAIPPTQRKMMAEYMERHAVRTRARCVCTAMISDSAVTRAMLTAIFWLREPVVETRVFANLSEGKAWARSQVDRVLGSHARSSSVGA